MNILEVKNVSKTYNGETVLKNISFHISPHEIIGLIGKNGAGKSTLMKIIVDLIKCDSGEIKICNYDVKDNREKALQKTSVLIEGPSLYSNLTVKEHLKLNAYLRNIEKSKYDEAIQYLNLDNHLNKRISKLSLGMKQQVALAICFMNDSDLYLLDEPINGLDFENVMIFRNKISHIKNQNKSILISSHILKELELVADRYLFLEDGQLIEIDKSDVSNIEKKYEEIINVK